MRSYRFHSLTEQGAHDLAQALNEDGLKATIATAGARPLPGWVVEATGDDRSESLLEMLAQFFGGAYEGEDLAGA